MTDVTGFPALDVLIGLAFVYFLLSLVTSALTEAVAGLFNLRFRTLRRGIQELLDYGLDKKQLEADLNDALAATDYDTMLRTARGSSVVSPEEEEEGLTSSADKLGALTEILERKKTELSLWQSLEASPRMMVLWKETGFFTRIYRTNRRGPSYIPPRAFVLSLLDTIAPPTNTDSHDVVKRAKEAVQHLQNPVLKSWLQDALAEAVSSREKLLSSLETSFDGVMNRVSGWYKRYSTIWILVFSVILAGAVNVDSYAIGKRLWQDEAVRSAVVARATKLTEATCNGSDSGNKPTPLTVDEAAKCVSKIKELGLPLGWGAENQPASPWDAAGKALGLLVTVFALMLGAPFWFDTLGKLARLRTTGKREGTVKSDARAAVDRDERRV